MRERFEKAEDRTLRLLRKVDVEIPAVFVINGELRTNTSFRGLSLVAGASSPLCEKPEAAIRQPTLLRGLRFIVYTASGGVSFFRGSAEETAFHI